MPRRVYTKDEIVVAEYAKRNEAREDTLITATMDMVGYFMGLGDDQPTAEGKVKQLSDDIRIADAGAKFDYVLGNTQPLKDAIQASTLPFMDQAAKDFLIAKL